MPNIYKTFTKDDIAKKIANQTPDSTKNTASTIISNFISYFKTKHLG